ncbi:MAG: chemotaxis protein CheW [Microcoleaceae cyanobacterium]
MLITQTNPEPSTFKDQPDPENLLTFFLTPDFQMSLPTSELIEVVKLEVKKLTPISGMPTAVAGVYLLQDEVIWLVDLSYLLGFSTNIQSDMTANFSLLKVKTQRGNLGILIQQVGQIISSSTTNLQLQSDKTAWLNTLSQRGWLPKQTEQLKHLVKALWINSDELALPVLDVEEILLHLE